MCPQYSTAGVGVGGGGGDVVSGGGVAVVVVPMELTLVSMILWGLSLVFVAL